MRELSSIKTVVMQVTEKCPFECPQCYAQRGGFSLPIERAEQILDRTFRNRSGLLQITGGEPMVYPNLLELVDFCHGRNITTAIATSGYGCTEDYLNQLKTLGLSCLCVSINGSTKAIHERTRRGYDEAISAIKASKECELPCVVNWVACESNADDLLNVILLCEKMGVDALCILKKQPSYDGSNVDYPNSHQIEKIRQAIKSTKSISISVKPCFYELNEGNSCLAGEDSFYVDCNGMVSACSMLRKRYATPSEMMCSDTKLEECLDKRLQCHRVQVDTK